jgi:hypothetical protein
MNKVVALGVTYWEIDLGFTSLMSFDPQELVERMASMNLSLN